MTAIRPMISVLQVDTDNNDPTVFDNPDADIVLRSRDSKEFRVVKLYIINSSPVLRKQINAFLSDSSRHATSSSGKASLPVLQLADNSGTLSSLLTFIFPMSPVLPPTLEEVMELLSVAQKYEMVSVLDHVRGIIALRDPSFICHENAFHVYSLARKHGLRQEAAQAAKASLAFTLSIDNLEDMSGISQGVYLRELWKYHQAVQSHLVWNMDKFRRSAAGATLTGITCLSRTRWNIPYWIDYYIRSIAASPVWFNPVAFQTDLARHVSGESSLSYGLECTSCTTIPHQTMRKFWTALTNFVNENIAKAESSLSIPEPGHEDHICVPALPPLPESLYLSEPDLIIQSSDSVKFRVHKSILVFSSQVFRDIFSLPQPSNEIVDGLPMLRVSEDAELVRALITVLYPIPSEILVAYDRVLSLLAAAQKYDMPAALSSIRAEVGHRKVLVQSGDQAFRAFAIASRNRLSPETDATAHLTLDYPMTLESIENELHLYEGWALRDLAIFRRCRRDDMVSCLYSFLDGQNSPSKVWLGCPEAHDEVRSFLGVPVNTARAILPLWLSKIFIGLIAELKSPFEPTLANPLIQPSSFRKKYFEALQSHTLKNGGHNPPKACDFCFVVHARQGEAYCTELEQKLALARDKAFESALAAN